MVWWPCIGGVHRVIVVVVWWTYLCCIAGSVFHVVTTHLLCQQMHNWS